MTESLDRVNRRVCSLIYDMVECAYDYPRPEPDFAWCGCGHADDEHYGEHGEKHCSADGCGCGKFAEVAA